MPTMPAIVSPKSEFKRTFIPRSDSTLLTGEEVFALGDIGCFELVKGKIIRMPLTGHPHGYIEVNFAIELGNFVRQHKLGRVLAGEVGIYTERNPDTVRGADVAFISNERLSKVKSESYLDIAPELIVEVKSPSDRWNKIEEKLAEYFAIDVKMVWVAEPKRKMVHVYHSLTDVKHLTKDEKLSGEEILPGFSVLVADFF